MKLRHGEFNSGRFERIIASKATDLHPFLGTVVGKLALRHQT